MHRVALIFVDTHRTNKKSLTSLGTQAVGGCAGEFDSPKRIAGN